MLCCICREKEATVHLTQIAGDKASTIVFPIPMDLIGPLLERKKPA